MGVGSNPAASSGTSVRSRAPARRSTDQHRAARRAATSTPRAAGSIPTPTPAQRAQPGASIDDPAGFDTPPPAATHTAECGTHPAEGRRHPLSLGDRRPGAVSIRAARYSTRRPLDTEPGWGWGRLRRRQAEQACAAEPKARRSTDQHRAAPRAATSTPRAAGSIPTPTPAQRQQPGASIDDPVGFDTPPPAALTPQRGAAQLAGGSSAFSCSAHSGVGRVCHWERGQITAKPRPRARSTGTKPPPGSPMWARESAEAAR